MSSFAVNDGTGAVINYEIVRGIVPETVFFIHGNLASNRWWYPAQKVWEANSSGNNHQGALIYAEFRGCGLSSKPKQDSEVDLHRFADDFIALIRSLNLGPIHLVGHSTGGTIAALMLTKSPELFKKAILLDPVGAQGVKFDPRMIDAFEQMKVNKDVVAMVLGSTIYQNDSNSDFFKTVIVEDGFSGVKAIGHLVLKALDGFDVRAEVSMISNPVLVLHGEHDQLLDIEESKKLANLIKSATFRTISGQGHCANIEAPKLFVSLVEDFLF
ncbi:MAG: alpha/beta hydrolase [Bdellovibrionaceae bacterium]|nr:alpha/beta hydrolase [Pseudobdellovibrionaceae bacterium]